MAKKILFALVLVVAVLSCSGCFDIAIKQDVDFPAGSFAAARERLAVMERHNPDRAGKAAKMHVMVYDGRSREVVQVTVPMWMVKLANKDEEHESMRQPQDVADRYVDFDWSDLEHVSRLGPGLLVQVEDGKENTHVLIWLE